MTRSFYKITVSSGILLCGLVLVMMRPKVPRYGTGKEGPGGAAARFCEAIYLNPGSSAILAVSVVLAVMAWRLPGKR